MAKIFRDMARFNLSDHVNVKLFVLMLAGFVFLAFSLSLIIIMVNIRDRKIVEESLQEQAAFVRSLDSSLDSLRAADFSFPEEDNPKRTEPFLQREPQKGWTQEEIGKYWIEPDDTGIADISRENRRLIESLLEEIP